MGSLSERIQMLSVQFVPFIVAVVFHEYAHGLIAYVWGDRTAKKMGRLTLNPVPHLDPLGTIIFPMINMISGMNILIGWARPVPIDPSQFKKYRPGLFWVSLAGPGMNFLLAVLSAALFFCLLFWVPRTFYLFEPLLIMSRVSIQLNYMLAIFNLIPLPPLDGSKMVQAFLSLSAARKYESVAQYSFFILLALLMTGALSVISYPIYFCSDLTLRAVGMAFGYIFGFDKYANALL